MNTTALAAAIVISLIIGAIIRRYLIDSMTNLHVASEAADYLKRDSVNITTEIDTYLFTNLSVIPKSKDEDDDENKKDAEDDDGVDDDSDDVDDDSDGGDDSGGSDGD